MCNVYKTVLSFYCLNIIILTTELLLKAVKFKLDRISISKEKINMRSFSDIQYGKLNHPLQKLDIHLPDEGNTFPIFIYFHGGGLKKGDKSAQSLYDAAKTMEKDGIALVSVNYRMYPDAKYPDYIEDCAEAVAWIFSNIEQYCKPNGIYVGGSSAGGYLSMMLCFDKSWLGKYGISPLDVKGYIHGAGQPTAHFEVLNNRGIDSKRVIIDETAPLYHIGVDDTYSPMLFIISDNDMQNRYEQTMLTISTLKHFGHEGDKVKLIVMHGKHCQYIREYDENGVFNLGKVVTEFIKESL